MSPRSVLLRRSVLFLQVWILISLKPPGLNTSSTPGAAWAPTWGVTTLLHSPPKLHEVERWRQMIIRHRFKLRCAHTRSVGTVDAGHRKSSKGLVARVSNISITSPRPGAFSTPGTVLGLETGYRECCRYWQLVLRRHGAPPRRHATPRLVAAPACSHGHVLRRSQRPRLILTGNLNIFFSLRNVDQIQNSFSEIACFKS